MSLLDWRPEYELGIPSIDFEHRRLVELINQLHDSLERREAADPAARQAAVLDFLGEIYARISAHFALEEEIMRARRYDEYEAHKADHERLLDELRTIMDEVAARPEFDYETALADRLREWWTVHSRTKDARLHRMVHSDRGGRPGG